MQESGDVQPVMRWGKAWLEDNATDRRARDVALTAALAHCDLAGALLHQHSIYILNLTSRDIVTGATLQSIPKHNCSYQGR